MRISEMSGLKIRSDTVWSKFIIQQNDPVASSYLLKLYQAYCESLLTHKGRSTTTDILNQIFFWLDVDRKEGYATNDAIMQFENGVHFKDPNNPTTELIQKYWRAVIFQYQYKPLHPEIKKFIDELYRGFGIELIEGIIYLLELADRVNIIDMSSDIERLQWNLIHYVQMREITGIAKHRSNPKYHYKAWVTKETGFRFPTMFNSHLDTIIDWEVMNYRTNMSECIKAMVSQMVDRYYSDDEYFVSLNTTLTEFEQSDFAKNIDSFSLKTEIGDSSLEFFRSLSIIVGFFAMYGDAILANTHFWMKLYNKLCSELGTKPLSADEYKALIEEMSDHEAQRISDLMCDSRLMI